jgi:hypothetical protein
MSTAPAVELGFVEDHDPDSAPLAEIAFDDWDGGKVGGKPIWLVPSRLPPAPTCGRCQRVMPLLVQLFAPIDDAGANPHAYYRMLYVFSCTSGSCVNRAGGSDDVSRSVIVVRCQTNAIAQSAAPAATCEVCGHCAPNRCSKCKVASYCSREHQTVHWRASHKDLCSKAPSATSRGGAVDALVATGCILPEFELYTEAEPPLAERRRLEIEALPSAARLALSEHNEAVARGSLSASGGADVGEQPRVTLPPGSTAAAGDGGEDAAAEALSLAGVTQRKLAELTGAQLFADQAMRTFQQRVVCRPAQVVRYLRWSPLPLWRPTESRSPVRGGGGAVTDAPAVVALQSPASGGGDFAGAGSDVAGTEGVPVQAAPGAQVSTGEGTEGRTGGEADESVKDNDEEEEEEEEDAEEEAYAGKGVTVADAPSESHSERASCAAEDFLCAVLQERPSGSRSASGQRMKMGL